MIDWTWPTPEEIRQHDRYNKTSLTNMTYKQEAETAPEYANTYSLLALHSHSE